MNRENPLHQNFVNVNLDLLTQKLVRNFPDVTSVAALDAAIATTKLAIQSDLPSLEDIVLLTEDGIHVPKHLFLAHNIIDSLDELRITIQAYLKHLNLYLSRFSKFEDNDIPF